MAHLLSILQCGPIIRCDHTAQGQATAYSMKGTSLKGTSMKRSIVWGIVVGVNWTYGNMFDVLLIKADMNGFDRGIAGLVGCAAVLFFTSSLHSSPPSSRSMPICKIVTLLSIVCLQANASIEYPYLLQERVWNMGNYFMLRAGLTVLSAGTVLDQPAVGLFAAVTTNLIGNLVADFLPNPQSHALFCTFVLGLLVSTWEWRQ